MWLAVLGVTMAAGAVVGGLLGVRLLGVPEAASQAMAAGRAGPRLAQVLAELAMRGAGASSRTEPLEVGTAELNAFLARHVEARHLPLRPVLLHAGDGSLAVAGRTPLGSLGGAGGWTGRLIGWLPEHLRAVELWISAEGRVEVRPGEAQLVVTRAAVGDQPVPVGWLWRALAVDPRELLVWRLPRVVSAIEVRPGRLLIHTTRR